MQTLRNKYRDTSFEEASDLISEGSIDLLQYKYDGWFCQIESDAEGSWKAYSRTGRLLNQGTGLPPHTTLLGEYLFGTQWSKARPDYNSYVIFDCLCHDKVSLLLSPYYMRMETIRSFLCSTLDGNRMRFIPSVRAKSLDLMWSRCNQGHYEGLVLRNSHARHEDQVKRMKVSVEDTVICVGFIEGKGKHGGRLGALKAILPNGLMTTIGGGLSDEEREYIWANQHEFSHHSFDIGGKARFKSGAIRHPNFLRWKEPK